MARNPVQFQKGISLNAFLSLYGTEDQLLRCALSMAMAQWGFCAPTVVMTDAAS